MAKKSASRTQSSPPKRGIKPVSVERDPRVFERNRRPNKSAPCLALALDLGTSTGYSLTWFDPDKPEPVGTLPVVCGLWDLSIGPFDSGGIRQVRLRQFLARTQPDIIFYEDVKYSPPKPNKTNIHAILARTVTATELFGGFKAQVVTYATEQDIPCTALPIGAIKRRGTGRGNANKVDMINAANEEFDVGLDPEGYESSGHDNVADSLFILALGLDEYGLGVRPNE